MKIAVESSETKLGPRGYVEAEKVKEKEKGQKERKGKG